MTLRLFNTLTKSKDDFVPLDRKNVRMYVCGPTVYDFAHIGNARPAIVFDLLFRLLRHTYGDAHVTYVRNITDVDDKINARAAERGISIRELTEDTARIYNEDVAALGCLPPTVQPRATEHIPEMLEIINRLMSAQLAYAATTEDDIERRHLHVLFDVSGKPDYGKLSRRSLDEMVAGARVEVAPYKKNSMDFVLWKPSDESTPGWDSRFGRGRPGWHIECSAMAKKYLGETFDIHGGGIDLMFPHHENEIAQSEGAHGHPLANVWMHNGFLQVEGEKMSKSLGNFFTIRELLRLWPGDALRLNMLRTHYLQPIDWTIDGLLKAMDDLRAWAELIAWKVGEATDLSKVDGVVDADVVEALSDNLNTHLAFTRYEALFELAKKDDQKLKSFVRTGLFLGFQNLNKPGFFHHTFSAFLNESGPRIDKEKQIKFLEYRAATANSVSGANSFSTLAVQHRTELEGYGFSAEINDAGVLLVGNKSSGDLEAEFRGWVEGLIEARKAARAAKDFAESDRIRDELLAKQIVLKDGPQGTTWEVKR